MVLAKPARMKPRDIAEQAAGEARGRSEVRRGGLGRRAGLPQPHAQARGLAGPRARHPRCRRPPTAARTSATARRVNVEYVSANPTGPMHVGHCRGAVFGDVLANLLVFAGFDVTREYYVNDAGGQVDVLARSVFLRYREALGEDIGEIPQGLYPGDYLKPVGAALAKEHGRVAHQHARGALAADRARRSPSSQMMPMIKDDLAALNIKHDVFFSEASLTRAAPTRSRRRSRRCAPRASSTRGGWRSRRATRTRSGRTASRRCSSRPSSATRPTAR